MTRKVLTIKPVLEGFGPVHGHELWFELVFCFVPIIHVSVGNRRC